MKSMVMVSPSTVKSFLKFFIAVPPTEIMGLVVNSKANINDNLQVPIPAFSIFP
jgi:hypothetical protein